MGVSNPPGLPQVPLHGGLCWGNQPGMVTNRQLLIIRNSSTDGVGTEGVRRCQKVSLIVWVVTKTSTNSSSYGATDRTTGSTPVYCWQGHWTIEGTLYSHHTQTCISHASFKTACTCTHTHTHTHTQFWTVSMARKLTFLFLNVYIHVKDTRLYRFPANYPGNMRFPARKRRESEELSNEEAQGTRYCRHKAIVITAKAFMSTNDSITTVAMLGQ